MFRCRIFYFLFVLFCYSLALLSCLLLFITFCNLHWHISHRYISFEFELSVVLAMRVQMCVWVFVYVLFIQFGSFASFVIFIVADAPVPPKNGSRNRKLMRFITFSKWKKNLYDKILYIKLEGMKRNRTTVRMYPMRIKHHSAWSTYSCITWIRFTMQSFVVRWCSKVCNKSM